jgi:DNA polymerase-4
LSDEAKSIGAETTFSEDISEPAELERILWQMTEKVSRRTKRADLAGSTIVLKLKTRDFRLRTRSQTIADPTQLAERIFATARILLRREADGTAFRLIGVSLSNLSTAGADKELEDLELSMRFKARAERAMDRLRDKFGPAAVEKGLVFKRDASVENPPGNPPDWMDD